MANPSHLRCPHSHPVPSDTALSFYCPACRTNHTVTSTVIEEIISKSHGEYMEKLLHKVINTQSTITSILDHLTSHPTRDTMGSTSGETDKKVQMPKNLDPLSEK